MDTSVTANVVRSDGSLIRAVTGTTVAEVLQNSKIEPDPNTWIWLNPSSDPLPESALLELLKVAERSPSVGVVGPKQVAKSNPRVIRQLGLTLTPLGAPFSPVTNELDQGQHDDLLDVLAVGVAGMLIRSDVLEIAGGWSEHAPLLAQDIDFCVRVRMAGFRVAVAPAAHISFDGLLPDLGRASKLEQRKAAIHLRFRFAPLPLAFAYALALLPLALLRVFYRLSQKRPNLIWSELVGGIWGLATLGSRIASRTQAPMLTVTKLSRMRLLRASWQQVRADARTRSEADEQAHNLAAFERGEHENLTVAKTFTQASGWLVMVLLAVASWQLFPSAISASGAATAPLSSNIAELFARAGAAWQPIGPGFFAPSDPFNWVLLALGGVTAWAPQLSIGVLLFLARSLAFASAWRAIGLVTSRTWLRTILAIAYAFMPALTTALSDGRVSSVVTAVMLPWLVLSVARAAGVGRRGSARSDRQTWSWVAASALSLAVVGASTPNLIPVALLVLAVAAFGKIRRFGYLFWIPLPLAALFIPYAVYLVVRLGEPLAVIADPGIAYESKPAQLVFAAGFALIGTLAVLAKRWALAAILWLIIVGLLVASWFVTQISFGEVHGNGEGYLHAASLLLALSVALLFDQQSRSRIFALVLTVSVLAPLAYLGVTTTVNWQPSDGRVVPWLLELDAATDSTMLVLEPSGAGYNLSWVSARGKHLEDENTSYRLGLAQHVAQSDSYKAVVGAAANLASANALDVSAELQQHCVGYVLVPSGDSAKVADLASALDSSPILETAGITGFGHLWRVKNYEGQPVAKSSLWSVTKGVQGAVLLGFVLLALPSRLSKKAKRDSEIFFEESEDNA